MRVSLLVFVSAACALTAALETKLADDDEPIRYSFGECYFEVTKDGADELLESQKLNSQHVAVAMGRIGSETQSAEAQKELNMDVDIRLKQLRSNEVDVDFAEAVAKFNVELARLEASQAAFAKLSRLSLFEYL